jgi:ATP synthase F1 gamma subunit
MANVLDIRRRIRSVKSTRQITKAMKMVSAAKLRRAQERALAARPYAKMLTSVLKSLYERADVIDPETRCWRRGQSATSWSWWSPETADWPVASTAIC